MSTTITKQAPSKQITQLEANPTTPHDIQAVLNYYLDPEDGSPPEPNYVTKPSSYDRPVHAVHVTVHDIRGSEDQYTLDTSGFQVVNHVSKEKDFVNEEKIKSDYYKEVEELLKKESVAHKPPCQHPMRGKLLTLKQDRGIENLHLRSHNSSRIP